MEINEIIKRIEDIKDAFRKVDALSIDRDVKSYILKRLSRWYNRLDAKIPKKQIQEAKLQETKK